MSSSPSDFVASLMSAQQSLTAVDLFGQRVAEATPALHGQYYTDLIPVDSPQEGQQYAFEVDLDKCTGCKSCVAACHSLNGLDGDEDMFTLDGIGKLLASPDLSMQTSYHIRTTEG